MYRCQQCGSVVPSRTSSLWIPIEIRKKIYPPRENANRIRIRGKKKPILRLDPGGNGFEIVRELKVCGSCNERFQSGEIQAIVHEAVAPEPVYDVEDAGDDEGAAHSDA